MKFWLYDIHSSVEDGVETSHLYGFDETGKIVELFDSSVRPFIFAEFAALQHCKGKSVRKIIGLQKTPLLKLEGEDASVDVPKMVTFLKKREIETYNSDKYYTGVYMEERGFTPCMWHEILGAEEIAPGLYDLNHAIVKKLPEDYSLPPISALALDIEVHNQTGGRLEIERDPIVLAGLEHVDSGGNRTTIMIPAKGLYDDVLLEDVCSAIKEFGPTFIVTYNGNEFDWDYIIKRAHLNWNRLRIALDNSQPHVTEYQTVAIHGRPTIDLFGMAKFIVPKGSRKTLPVVHAALKAAGLAPKDHYYYEINRDDIAKLWDNPKTRDEVIKHCESDVELTMDVFDYALGFLVELSRITNLPPDEVISVPYSILVEGFLIQVAKEYGYAVPRNEYREQPHTTGADNIEPKKGILEDISVFDFAQMYPNILIENNISPETYVTMEDMADMKRGKRLPDTYCIESDTGKRYYFLKEPKGFFRIAMEILLERIKEAKKAEKGIKYTQKYAGRAQALKTIARSMYGYFKSPKSRWHSPACQEAVASEGRNRITKAIIVAEDHGFEVIYGDTDSIFVSGLKREDCEEFSEVLSESVGSNVGFEKMYQVLFFTDAKKIYAGIDEDGKLDVVGFTKSDWVPLANRVQKKILEIILKERDPEKARKFVKITENAMRAGVYPLRDFIIWKKVRSPLEEYPQIGQIVEVRGKKRKMSPPAHVVVARRDPDRFIEEDGTVGYVVVPGPKKSKVYEVARSYKEVNSVKDLDFDWYMKHQIGSVADRILKYFFGGVKSSNNYAEL